MMADCLMGKMGPAMNVLTTAIIMAPAAGNAPNVSISARLAHPGRDFPPRACPVIATPQKSRGILNIAATLSPV
jgi:hypothetical protein